MRKQIIVLGAILGGMLGVAVAVYLLFLQSRVQAYQDADRLYANLEAKLRHFNQIFSNTQADKIAEKWRAKVQPWAEAVEERKGYFNLGNALEINPVPEDKLARFYYEEQYYAMLEEMYSEAATKGIYLPSMNFGVPDPESLTNQAPSRQEVEAWLRWIAFGRDTVRLLLDANPVVIHEVALWPPETDESQVLEWRRVGLSFAMTLENLCKFQEKLLTNRKQYYDVTALRVSNRYLRYSPDPWLEVQMVLSRCQFVEPTLGEVPAAPGMGAVSPGFAPPPTSPVPALATPPQPGFRANQ